MLRTNAKFRLVYLGSVRQMTNNPGGCCRVDASFNSDWG